MRLLVLLLCTMISPVVALAQSSDGAACPNPAAYAFTGQGRVLFDAERAIYPEPGVQSEPIGMIAGGGTFAVISDSALCVAGALWRQVAYEGVEGWIVTVEGPTAFVEPWVGQPLDAAGDDRQPSGRLVFGATRYDDQNVPTHGIYTIHADGNDLRAIATYTTPIERAALSPDRTWVLFTAATDSGRALYRQPLDADGGQTTLSLAAAERLTPDGMNASNAILSPDGRRIAFLVYVPATDSRLLYGMNADGSDLRRLSALPVSPFSQTAWLPDGNALTFQPQAQEVNGVHAPLAEIAADGVSEPAIYTVAGAGTSYSVCGYQWHPFHHALVANVALDDCVAGSEPYYLAPGATELQPIEPLASDGLYSWGMAWMPDGTRATYTSEQRGGPAQVFSVLPDGTALRQHTVSPGVVGAGYDYARVTGPAWSPDGEWLAVVWWRRSFPGGSSRTEVHITDAAGSRYWPLLTDLSGVGDVSWLAWLPTEPNRD